MSALQGIDLATPGKHDVKFTINREAGRIDAEGFVKDGEGAGIFRFEPDPNYAPAMARLGFDGIDAHKQFAMAMHDVTQEFARTMKAENLPGLDTDKLIAFRIFNVNPQFIRELRAEGLPAKDADTLIAFRVHEVTPAIVRELRKTGLELDEDHLIAFAVHEVTPEYVAKVDRMGLGQPGCGSAHRPARTRRDAGVHRPDEIARPEEPDPRPARGAEGPRHRLRAGRPGARIEFLSDGVFRAAAWATGCAFAFEPNPRSARASTEMLAEGDRCFGCVFHVNL